jgi:hypothetical protein
MKKIVFTAAVLVLAASCTRELPESPKHNENLVQFTIANASGPVMNDADKASGSKTVLANIDGSVVNWTAGDNAVLFDNSGSCAGHLFSGTVHSDKTKIDLTGEMDEGSTAYWLLYPYNSGASMSDGVITTTLSTSQTAVAGSFADKTAISLASGTRTPGQSVASGLSFQNLCPLIAFDMPSYVDGAQSITLTPNSGCAIAGTISFNASTGAMTAVSGASSITLNGPIAAGERYFIAVAPKTYENGFTLTVTTAGNQTYSASTTKTIDAAPGKVYYLGTLGLKLDVTPTVTFNHTYSNNVLTGSTATLNIPVASELAAMISSWSATLKNSDNVVVRNYSSNSGTGSIANGYTYLPKGSYTLTATYTTLDGRSKTLAHVAVNHNVNPNFSVSVSGYTSYNYGVGADGYSKNVSTANGLDGSSIYGLGTSVTISADLMNDSKYSKSYTYSYDGGTAVSVSGNSASIANKSGQSWAKHTLSASCTFDGVSQNASRDLHITGLPWETTTFTEDTWDKASWNVDLGTSYVKLGGVSGSGKANVTSKTKFNIPSNITVKVYVSGCLKSYATLGNSSSWLNAKTRTTFNVKLADGTAISRESSSSEYEKEVSFTNLSGNGTFTSSNCKVFMESTYTAAGPYAKVNYIKLEYR